MGKKGEKQPEKKKKKRVTTQTRWARCKEKGWEKEGSSEVASCAADAVDSIVERAKKNYKPHPPPPKKTKTNKKHEGRVPWGGGGGIQERGGKKLVGDRKTCSRPEAHTR